MSHQQQTGNTYHHHQRQRQQREQQYPEWEFFNYPVAGMIQLLLDHLEWTPAPVYAYSNGHRGERQQQRQQEHQYIGQGVELPSVSVLAWAL